MFVMRYLYRFLWLLACVALAGVSFFLSERGFDRIQDFRMLERIPLTSIDGSVGGETQLEGKARQAGETLAAPKSGTRCLYYRYLVEREERDSDGDTHWRTVRDETRAIDFVLDEEGEGAARALVDVGTDRSRIEWSVERKYFQEQGDYRYTEWRIDPGDRITVFGWFHPGAEPRISFIEVGQYLPIVSSFGAAAERGDLGMLALLALWGGVSAMVFACLALVASFRIHRTLVFLLLVSVTSALLLFHYGYRSLERDVSFGYTRVIKQQQRSAQMIQRAVSPATFPGLSEPWQPSSVDAATQERINEWRIVSHLVRARYHDQIGRFPESLYAAVNGMSQTPPVYLSPELATEAERRAGRFERTSVAMPLFFSVVGIALIAGAAWFAFRLIRVKRMQENLPTSKTAGVTFGLAEVNGMLMKEEGAQLFKGPVSGTLCTWYRYVIEERRGSGKNAKWVEILDKTEKQPFRCEDDEGSIRVFPTNAEVISRHKQKKREGNRRYTEWRLSPGDELYILGKARLDKTRGDSLVFGHDKEMPYIIANISEAEVMFRKAIQGMALLSVVVSLLFLLGIWIGGSNGNFSSLDFIMAAMVAPTFLVFVVFVLMYNDLVFLRERCERNWANIQVSLKKRANLIPQLQNVVKEYLGHEQHLQKGLALLRKRSQASATETAVNRYMAVEHASITELNARLEQYPDLKGSEVIADLTRRLIKLENEVALIREGFNDAVMQYRTRCASFPDNLLARVFGFEAMKTLTFDRAAHQVPSASTA